MGTALHLVRGADVPGAPFGMWITWCECGCSCCYCACVCCCCGVQCMCRVICVDVIKWRIAVCMGKVWLQGTEFRV